MVRTQNSQKIMKTLLTKTMMGAGIQAKVLIPGRVEKVNIMKVRPRMRLRGVCYSSQVCRSAIATRLISVPEDDSS